MESKIGIIKDANVGLRWTTLFILTATDTVEVTAKTGYLFSLMDKYNINFHKELIDRPILLEKDEIGQLHWHTKLELI